jgi:hypothetical protein
VTKVKGYRSLEETTVGHQAVEQKGSAASGVDEDASRAWEHPFLWLSGANLRTILATGEQGRYGLLGALILLMSVWSGAMMALAVSTSLHPPLWATVGMGVFFFLFILGIDRLINGRPLMSDRWGYRFRNVLLARGLLAVVVATVVTHSAMVFIFSGEI